MAADPQPILQRITDISEREREANEAYQQARDEATAAKQRQAAAKRHLDNLRAELADSVAAADAEGAATRAELVQAAGREWTWFYRALERAGG